MRRTLALVSVAAAALAGMPKEESDKVDALLKAVEM